MRANKFILVIDCCS